MSMVMSLPVLLVADIVAVNTISEPSVVVLAERSMMIPESSASSMVPVASEVPMDTPKGAPVTFEIRAMTVSSPSKLPSTSVVTFNVPLLLPSAMVMVALAGMAL